MIAYKLCILFLIYNLKKNGVDIVWKSIMMKKVYDQYEMYVIIIVIYVTYKNHVRTIGWDFPNNDVLVILGRS